MAVFRRHPLQRLHAPSRGASALLHAAGLVSFASSFRYLAITPNPINDSYGWHFQYLTIIGLFITTLSFTSGLLSDITLSPILFTIKNALSRVATPLAVLISLLYWTLKSIDPKLVIPETSPNPPLIVDLGFHLFPTLLLTLDLLFFSPPSEMRALSSMGLSGVIAGAYWFWVEWCFERNGFYPYPLFRDAGFEGRIALFTGAAVVMVVNTWGLRWLYGVVNGVEIASEGKKAQ